jgi:putative chitinase
MTPAEFAQATGATTPRVTEHMHHIEHAMAVYDINTPARQAAFLSQIGHESGGLKWIKEIWGPTDTQRRYEMRTDLGNNRPGDGFLYRGRGWIQLTGRDNYRRASQRLRERFPDCPDFEADPDAVATARWAALTAAEFWHNAGLNALADQGRYETITRRINGGLNGYADRLARYEDAKQALA